MTSFFDWTSHVTKLFPILLLKQQYFKININCYVCIFKSSVIAFFFLIQQNIFYHFVSKLQRSPTWKFQNQPTMHHESHASFSNPNYFTCITYVAMREYYVSQENCMLGYIKCYRTQS